MSYELCFLISEVGPALLPSHFTQFTAGGDFYRFTLISGWSLLRFYQIFFYLRHGPLYTAIFLIVSPSTIYNPIFASVRAFGLRAG